MTAPGAAKAAENYDEVHLSSPPCPRLHVVGGRALHASVLHADAAESRICQLGEAQRLDIDVVGLALGAGVWCNRGGRVGSEAGKGGGVSWGRWPGWELAVQKL